MGTGDLGVAYFYMSRMEEAASELQSALALFEQIDDRNGKVAASSFLCLAKPADKRVPGWLADALEYAEQAGDRSKEMTVLTTLAWHQFSVRSVAEQLRWRVRRSLRNGWQNWQSNLEHLTSR